MPFPCSTPQVWKPRIKLEVLSLSLFFFFFDRGAVSVNAPLSPAVAAFQEKVVPASRHEDVMMELTFKSGTNSGLFTQGCLCQQLTIVRVVAAWLMARRENLF